MRAHRDSGLTVTFTAQTGKTLSVSVPGRFIAEELTAVDATRAALAANAAQSTQPAPAAAATAPAPPASATAPPAPAAAAPPK